MKGSFYNTMSRISERNWQERRLWSEIFVVGERFPRTWNWTYG